MGIEDILISYATSNNLRYDDYYVNRAGRIIFRCFDKKNKERWFTVFNLRPLRLQECV